jgi:hypothetical protein
MYPTLTVNKNSHFFVTLCKDNNSFHSFFTLGVESGNEKILLGSFGKIGAEDGSCCGLLFWDTKARIKNERMFVKPSHAKAYNFVRMEPGIQIQPNTVYWKTLNEQTLQYTVISPSGETITDTINPYEPKDYTKKFILKTTSQRGHTKIRNVLAEMSYKAYSISYDQYLEFLDYLKNISRAQSKKSYSRLEAYCPTNETESEITLKWMFLENHSDRVDEKNIDHNHERIGKSNNCRHSAIGMVKRATGLKDLGKGISSLFCWGAPLNTKSLSGKLGADGSYIYILPLPPTSFTGISKQKLDIITKLYNRLDELILCKQDNKLTIEKFEKIKSLYESITANEESILSEIFAEINSWVTDNKALISTHRRQHWISFQTATEKMFNKLLASMPAESEASYSFDG